MLITGVSGKRKGSKRSVHEFRNLADEGQALIMLKRRMGVLGIKESDLKAKTKGAVEKQVLAWR